MRVLPRRRAQAVLAAAALSAGLSACAARAASLMPHETALLVNRNSDDSVAIANRYALLRGIPDIQVVFLDVPGQALSPPYEISWEQYQSRIRAPVIEALEARGVADHTLAWVFSADFPVRVRAPGLQPMALTGVTLLGDSLPEEEALGKGLWRSPFFGGPDDDGARLQAGRVLRQLLSEAAPERPVPSMMLSFTRSRGLSVPETETLLQRAAAADGSRPRGGIYFVRTGDAKRSNPRHWQYEPAARILSTMGAEVSVRDEPAADAEIMGYLTGLQQVEPRKLGRFNAGSMADHLTSFAAVFDTHQQTKLTEWLRAGATVSAGTVTEPLSIWTKFPTAFFFISYARGCTALESMLQAVRSPLQLLTVGDPLCAPYIEPGSMSLVLIEDGPQSGPMQVLARLWTPANPARVAWEYFVDGRRLPVPPATGALTLDTEQLADGYHTVLAAAHPAGSPYARIFDFKGFTVRNRGRAVRIVSPAEGEVDGSRPVRLDLEVDGEPTETGIESRGVTVARDPAGERRSFSLEPGFPGPGPAPIQGYAVYEGGERVRSEPVMLEFRDLNRPPRLTGVSEGEGEGGLRSWEAQAEDPDGDPVEVRWMGARLSAEPERGPDRLTGGSLSRRGEAAVFTPAATNAYDLAVFEPVGEGPAMLVAEMALRPGGRGDPGNGTAGVAFRIRDRRNFQFAALFRSESKWVLGECVDGVMKTHRSLGARVDAGDWQRIEVEADAAGRLRLRVGTALRLEWNVESAEPGLGSVGLMTAAHPASFRTLCVNPPSFEGILTQSSGALLLADGEPDPSLLRVLLNDGRGTRLETLPGRRGRESLDL
jgi:uncharacterized protein (TIGR03790 family)